MTTASVETPTADTVLEPTPPEVKRYQRQKLIASLASMVLSFALLAFLALIAGPYVDRFVRSYVGDNAWLRLLALACVYGAAFEVLTLPLDFWSGYVLEHRYGLSNQSLGKWAWQQVKGYLVEAPLGLGLLAGLYAVLWYGGPYWWLWAAAGWLLVTLVLGQLFPVLILPLFFKVTRVEDVALLDRLRRLADGTGLRVEGIYRLHLSEETKKANAALAGLGRTRRVLLGDTLLDNFTPDEIDVVFAHEVGHHIHRHLLQMVAVSVVLAPVGLWLADFVLRRMAPALGYPAFDDPSALPLLGLVLSVFFLILMPAQNALSRFYERQCDRYALRRTGRPDAFRSAFVKLARQNKADADPHPLAVWFLYSHPSIRQRLALADQVSSLETVQ